MITVLSGGVGAARLLRALSEAVDPSELTAVVNVGDDLVLHGLTICPDLDTITYTLAGLNNDELGWGLRGETWRVMDELAELGGAAWFRLGDRDLATHLYRSQRLAEGATKTEVTRELADASRASPSRCCPSRTTTSQPSSSLAKVDSRSRSTSFDAITTWWSRVSRLSVR